MKPQDQAKLEYKLLYSLVVAGKSATFAERVMQRFFGIKHVDELATAKRQPFAWVRYLGNNLETALRSSRSGNYTKLTHAFMAVAESGINLRTCTPQDLEAIKGIGPKTSRFFILWTRKNESYAALDTHILKWLRYLGHKAPKSTPTGAKYAELEKVFLAEVKKRNTTTSELDYAIWEHCRDNAKVGTDYNNPLFWPVRLRKI